MDWDDQIVDPEWAAEKLADWFKDVADGGFNATMHQMHSPLLAPAGKGKDLTFEGGVPVVRAKIVEPTAIKLIDEKVYGAFSIGILDPPIFPDPQAKNGRIGRKGAGGFINEVSLVDVPANPRCLFSLAKRRRPDGRIRETGRVQVIEDGQLVRQPTPDQLSKAFVAALTATKTTKKKGKKMSDTATKADKTKAAKGESMPDGASKCKSCPGADCGKCGGKGWTMPDKGKALVPVETSEADQKVLAQAADAAEAARRAGDVAGAAVGAAVTKSLTKDADDDVDDALDDIAGDLKDAMTAQAEDEVDDAMGKTKKVKVKKEKKAKADKPKPDDGEKKPAFPGATPPFSKPKKKKGKKKGKGKGSKMGNGAGGGEAGANVEPDVGASTTLPSNALVMEGGVGKKKGKKKGRKGIPSLEKRLHDMLCPSYGGKALKSVYGAVGKDLPLVEVLSPDYFAARMAEVSSGKGEGDVADALRALQATTRLSSLSPKTFLEMREAASHKFMDGYPGVHLTPQMIDPEDFKRSFLSSAVPETSSVTRVPMPDLKTMFGPEQFDRGPLTTNETRPTLSSGTSVAKGKKGKKGKSKGNTAGAGNPNSRQFYTNSAKDQNQDAMALLHDHIVNRYPGVCPLEATQPGTTIDSDGQMGSAAELQAKGPGVEALPTPSGAGDAGTLRPVGKKKSADKKKTTKSKTKDSDKAAGKAASQPDIEELVEKRVRKVTKGTERQVQRLGKRLKRTNKTLARRDRELDKALKAPDQRSHAHRGATPKAFRTPSADSETVLAAKQQSERIRTLKSRTHDPNSTIAMAAIETLREELKPGEFAKVMASDVEE